jgi:hypothetical protein
MEHTDFLQQHVEAHQDALRALNITMYNRPDREYHWFADFPYVIAGLDNGEGHIDAKVMAVKYPVTHHDGILVMPNEDNEYYEVGWGLTSSMEILVAYLMPCQKIRLNPIGVAE